jgi:hypothetical protein
MDTAWVSQATLAEEAVVAVPEAQHFPSMFARLFNQPHHSSIAHHCENPQTPPSYCRGNPNLIHHNLLHRHSSSDSDPLVMANFFPLWDDSSSEEH